jgi:hypothetical protein
MENYVEEAIRCLLSMMMREFHRQNYGIASEKWKQIISEDCLNFPFLGPTKEITRIGVQDHGPDFLIAQARCENLFIETFTKTKAAERPNCNLLFVRNEDTSGRWIWVANAEIEPKIRDLEDRHETAQILVVHSGGEITQRWIQEYPTID